MVPPKRRILYIRHKRGLDIADGFRMNQDEWVETLSMLSDVRLMSDDFDLDEACENFQPDFILYEAPALKAQPLRIANPKAHAGIPRLGFQMQDTYCNTRVNFLRAIEELDVRWLFSHMAEAALRQSPELKTRMFSVSLLFDPAVFRDYGLAKDIPVSVFGGLIAPELYHWRSETAQLLPHSFPVFTYAHPGYINPVPRHKFQVVGEDYARLLSRSHFSLADTTRIDCLVRKHLEIPACGAVLIAPDAPVLKPYGFKDMENCLLGSGGELVQKIAYVADRPEIYEGIRKAGHDLVHARYTRSRWRGILDFYECLRNLKEGETIRQEGMLGPFKAVPEKDASPCAIEADYPESAYSEKIKAWLAALLRDDGMAEAEKHLHDMSEWLFHMTEQWVPMGLMALLKGDGGSAARYFQQPQSIRLTNAGFADYDPEEIAWLSFTAALTGDEALKSLTRERSASLRHLSLRRMQWLGSVLAAGGDASHPPPSVLKRAPDDFLSIHWLGQLALEDWLRLVRRILEVYGQSSLLRV